MYNTLPVWASDTLREKGLGTGSDGLHLKVWERFQNEFDPSQFNANDLPNYFPHFVDSLLLSGWVAETQQVLVSQKRPHSARSRPLKRSSLDELEEKITHFLGESSPECVRMPLGEVVAFRALVACPHCHEQFDVSQEEFLAQAVQCISCRGTFNLR